MTRGSTCEQFVLACVTDARGRKLFSKLILEELKNSIEFLGNKVNQLAYFVRQNESKINVKPECWIYVVLSLLYY